MSTTLRLRHQGAVREVTLAADGDGATALIDGRALALARLPLAAPPYASAGAAVHEVAFVLDGRTHHAVVARTRDRILVALGARTWVFAPGEDEAGAGGAGGGTGVIVSPMPGKVVAVLVAAGERVEHGQPVVVLEAMKMETTLAADVDGTVATIAVAAGDTVDGGSVLVEITPA